MNIAINIFNKVASVAGLYMCGNLINRGIGMSGYIPPMSFPVLVSVCYFFNSFGDMFKYASSIFYKQDNVENIDWLKIIQLDIIQNEKNN